MKTENEYKQRIEKAELNIKKLKHELKLFDALTDEKPGLSQLQVGRALIDKVYTLYEKRILREKRSIEFHQKLLNNEPVSINFSLK